MTVETYLLFLSASFLLWITPGQDFIYTVTRSISQGRLAGIVSALGIGTGALFHAALAISGISLIILASPALFFATKLMGCGYLVYLGLSALLAKNERRTELHLSKDSFWKVFSQGVLSNVLNPKVALFFIAFLPQFVSTNHPTQDLTLLAFTFVIGGTFWCVLLACFAAVIAQRLSQNGAVQRWIGKLTGTVYLGLGLSILTTKS